MTTLAGTEKWSSKVFALKCYSILPPDLKYDIEKYGFDGPTIDERIVMWAKTMVPHSFFIRFSHDEKVKKFAQENNVCLTEDHCSIGCPNPTTSKERQRIIYLGYGQRKDVEIVECFVAQLESDRALYCHEINSIINEIADFKTMVSICTCNVCQTIYNEKYKQETSLRWRNELAEINYFKNEFISFNNELTLYIDDKRYNDGN